jgi:hypothetical protein
MQSKIIKRAEIYNIKMNLIRIRSSYSFSEDLIAGDFYNIRISNTCGDIFYNFPIRFE